MVCEQVETLLTLLALDELEGAVKAEVQAHLDQCAACREGLKDLRLTVDLLRRAAAEIKPTICAEHQAELLRAASLETEAATAPRRGVVGWARGHVWGLAAAVLVLCVLAGMMLPSLSRAREEARRAACLNNQRISWAWLLRTREEARRAACLNNLAQSGPVLPQRLMPGDGTAEETTTPTTGLPFAVPSTVPSEAAAKGGPRRELRETNGREAVALRDKSGKADTDLGGIGGPSGERGAKVGPVASPAPLAKKVGGVPAATLPAPAEPAPGAVASQTTQVEQPPAWVFDQSRSSGRKAQEPAGRDAGYAAKAGEAAARRAAAPPVQWDEYAGRGRRADAESPKDSGLAAAQPAAPPSPETAQVMGRISRLAEAQKAEALDRLAGPADAPAKPSAASAPTAVAGDYKARADLRYRAAVEKSAPDRPLLVEGEKAKAEAAPKRGEVVLGGVAYADAVSSREAALEAEKVATDRGTRAVVTPPVSGPEAARPEGRASQAVDRQSVFYFDSVNFLAQQKALAETASKSETKDAVVRLGTLGDELRVKQNQEAASQAGKEVAARTPAPQPAVPPAKPRSAEETKPLENSETARIEVQGGRSEVLPPANAFRAGPVNPWVLTEKDRFSTFAMDVDTASYNLARNFIRHGQLPPQAAVRMEEFVNNFDYNYSRQAPGVFNVHAEAGPSPFRAGLTLLKIGVAGRVVGREGRKPANLVFVVDASGSMAQADRMPLVQESLKALTNALDPRDRVSIVAFGTRANLVLDQAPAAEKARILQTIEAMRCGGATNLSEGLKVGYDVARRTFRAGATNRIVVCTDGIANVGDSEAGDLLRQTEEHRRQGVALTAAGFGAGAYNDALLGQLAKHGDGNYFFIDSPEEAQRVFVQNLAATIQNIARDAKVQVEFNATRVRRFRQVGFESRLIAHQDFRNDAVDAAEVGSGQSSTALYELELLDPPGHASPPDLGTVYVRYRNADTDRIEEIPRRLTSDIISQRTPESDPRFFLAACAAEFAEILRGSEHARDTSLDQVRHVLARAAAQLPLDARGQELLDLVTRSRGLPRAN